VPLAKTREFLMVACGQTHFAIQADVVRSVIRPEEADADGVLSTFGLITSPVHLSERFGLTGSYLSPESRILVCGMRATHFAFRVDCVLGLHDIDATKIRPLLPHFMGAERRWIAGLFSFQQTVALVLHTGWLLSNDRGRQALSSPVLELKTHGARPEAVLPSVMDVMAARRDSLDWNVLEFEEVTDADDTPWAQI
jgi:chemotaxis signal transduction protein